MTTKIQTKESMAVKSTSVKFTTKSKLKEEEAQVDMQGRRYDAQP